MGASQALSPQVSPGVQRQKLPLVSMGLEPREGGHCPQVSHCPPACPDLSPPAVVDPRPLLLAESVTPGQSVSLTCKAIFPSLLFQLLKDGVSQSTVKLDEPAFSHQFLLGEVTDESRGLYRCQSGSSDRWTGLSNLVEIAGKGELRHSGGVGEGDGPHCHFPGPLENSGMMG